MKTLFYRKENKMKYVNTFFVIWWLALLILYICGTYNPNKIVIGCSLFLAAMNFVHFDRE